MHIFFLVSATVKHYLKTQHKLDEVAIDLKLQQIGTYISHKICELNKNPKPIGLKITKVQSDTTNISDTSETQHESNSEKENERSENEEKEDEENDEEETTDDANKSDSESDNKKSNNESDSDSK